MEPLNYADDRPPAEPCYLCGGTGMTETINGSPSPCKNPYCDSGFIGIDPSVPTTIPPCGRKAPVLASRLRAGLPLHLPGDAKPKQLQPDDTTTPQYLEAYDKQRHAVHVR